MAPVDLLERRIRSARSTHGIAVLRFFAEPRLREIFPAYLVKLFHSMRAAEGLMEAAGERTAKLAPRCRIAARLESYWPDHIREEAGHADWILGDLRAFGVDPRALTGGLPPADVAELMGTLHFWTRHVHPVGALAYFYVVECGPPTRKLLDWLVTCRGLPREGLETFYRHAEIDRGHARKLQALIAELPLEDRHERLLAISAATVLDQLKGILDRLRRQAGGA